MSGLVFCEMDGKPLYPLSTTLPHLSSLVCGLMQRRGPDSGTNKSPALKFAINAEVCASLETFRCTRIQRTNPHDGGVRAAGKVLAFKWLLLFCRMAPSGVIKHKGKSK